MIDHPADDEVEITLFGRGKGESLVVHLGNRRWLVVDSFITGRGNKKMPVAQWYLDALDVQLDEVECLIVTHFHADHYRGIEDLYYGYPHARLILSDAWGQEQFRRVRGAPDAPATIRELAGIINHGQRSKIAPDNATRRLDTIHVGSNPIQGAGVSIRALSPTTAAVAEANAEVGAALIAGTWDGVDTVLKDHNRCSIALHLCIGDRHALLGADLIDHPDFGWIAALDHPGHDELEAVGYVKAPHHGSRQTADHETAWGRLLGDRPFVTVAPYAGSVPVPDANDLDHLAKVAGEVWVAAPAFDKDTHPRSEEIEEGREVNPERTVGFVRARRRADADHWDVRGFGAAHLSRGPA